LLIKASLWRAALKATHNLSVKPKNHPVTREFHELNCPPLPRLEPDSCACSDIQPKAACFLAIELKGFINFKKVVVGTHLDRSIARIRDCESAGFAPAIQLNFPALGKDFARDHGAIKE
jgi:hypothetical protein